MSGAAATLSSHDSERELLTGEAVALELRATSVILRMAGGIIDYLVYISATLLLAWGAFSLAFDTGLPEALYGTVVIACMVVGLVLVPATVETASQGKSLGRLALGDRIVRDDGGAISFRHAFIRSLVGVFEIVMTAGGLAVVVAMLNSRAKRLGDLLAGTYSQYERVSSVTPPVFGVPVELVEWASTADVARMPDALSRRIAQFLRQAAGHTAATRERLARDLATEAALYVSPVPGGDPELFLAGVSVLRREREATALRLERARLDELQPTLAALPHGFPDRG
ncbi:MAG: RDD family protein [Microcella sp.]|uniref:RDD family protein n=1 Tax=Microcella sp. TaxID=1913979 RepID=UPI0024CC7E1C|nr:RDD family protein [Microcella sp.]UYN82542.1 MAG: RDD family protein [Microcella sp.]